MYACVMRVCVRVKDQRVVTGTAFFCPATQTFKHWTASNATLQPYFALPLFIRVSVDRVTVNLDPASETDDVVLYRVTEDNGSTWKVFDWTEQQDMFEEDVLWGRSNC